MENNKTDAIVCKLLQKRLDDITKDNEILTRKNFELEMKIADILQTIKETHYK